MVINKPSTPAGNKGKTPFVCLSGNVRNVMSDKLNKNWSKGNLNSLSTITMRKAIQSGIGKREYLIELLGKLDAKMEITDGGGLTIKNMLTRAIPINTPPIKMTKSKLCGLMVKYFGCAMACHCKRKHWLCRDAPLPAIHQADVNGQDVGEPLDS